MPPVSTVSKLIDLKHMRNQVDHTLTSPAISTNSTVAGTTRSVCEIMPRISRRSSGTFTIPKLGSIVQNGKLDAYSTLMEVWKATQIRTCAELFSTNALKSVLFPTFGKPIQPSSHGNGYASKRSPTIPVLSAIEIRADVWIFRSEPTCAYFEWIRYTKLLNRTTNPKCKSSEWASEHMRRIAWRYAHRENDIST